MWLGSQYGRHDFRARNCRHRRRWNVPFVSTKLTDECLHGFNGLIKVVADT